MQERYARKNEAADLRRAFELLDSKHDGHIDAEELRDIFEKMNHKVKKAKLCNSSVILGKQDPVNTLPLEGRSKMPGQK